MRQRALIVDDEREARRRLARLLSRHSSQMEIVGEAVDGPTAVDAIQNLEPDLVFLDIEMPGLDGFGVLDSLRQEDWPLVIFATACDQYAIRAFEVHALDYLLKPITQQRLDGCLSRLQTIEPAAHRNRLESARRDNRSLERLMARSGAKLIVVNVKDVIAFESEDRLVFARTANGRLVLNITMRELAERLDGEAFCRVHKQAIVQLSHAREVHSLIGGHYLLKLSDGSDVQIGRNYAKEFRARFG